MKKSIVFVAALAASLAAVVPASAAFKFDIAENFNMFNDSRLEGQGRHYGFMFDLNDDIDLGFYMENADLQLTGDIGATPPNYTKLGVDMQAIRLVKKFTKWLDAGIDMGSAKVQQGANTGFGALAALNQNKPFVGILGTARYSAEVKEKLTADMNLSLGYRFLDLNDVATGIVNEKTVDDLNAFTISVGVGFRF